MTRIELSNVIKTYSRQSIPVVNHISLTVDPGTLLALLGPSGSGKSTLLKLIAGIEAPDRGDIALDGQSVLAVPAHRRGAVLMFQKAYLFPFLSVAENIAFGLKVQGASHATMQAEVRRMLDLIELPGIERKRPSQLSGGEQQRVALARALATRPRVLLLDEPFSSLDPAVRQTLQAAVQRIQGELGITTLLVTHDRGEALAMADKIALLDRGDLLACDTPWRLFKCPPTRRTARLMGITTFLRGDLVGGRLHSCVGTLEVYPEKVPEGHVTYAIRPEHMYLTCAPGPNALPARVVAETFRGESLEYQLQVGGEAIRVSVSRPFAASSGEQIYVAFPTEHLFPVCDDEVLVERST